MAPNAVFHLRGHCMHSHVGLEAIRASASGLPFKMGGHGTTLSPSITKRRERLIYHSCRGFWRESGGEAQVAALPSPTLMMLVPRTAAWRAKFGTELLPGRILIDGGSCRSHGGDIVDE